MQKVMWGLTIIGVFVSSYFFFVTLTASSGAPQEAAGAAISLCWVIIPYILARAVEKLSKPGEGEIIEPVTNVSEKLEETEPPKIVSDTDLLKKYEKMRAGEEKTAIGRELVKRGFTL